MRLRSLAVIGLAAVVAATSARVQAGFTATVFASANGSSTADTQTDALNDLSASLSVTSDGRVISSTASATFSDPNNFEVTVQNSWDWRNASGSGSTYFGNNFTYLFLADAGFLNISATNVSASPLFSGASTFGLLSFEWRLHDITQNTSSSFSFGGDGIHSFTTIDGHEYGLSLTDTSNVGGGPNVNLGLLHQGTFSISGNFMASATPVPEPTSVATWSLLAAGLSFRRHKRR